MPSPYLWSDQMQGIHRDHNVKPVLDDPRTDLSDEDLRLGYPFDVIRDRVIAKGLTDFRTGYQEPGRPALTTDEKVLLYCFVNLKKHFYTCTAAYETHHAAVSELFGAGKHPLIVDVGCGPGTACLALADLYRGRTFDYVGVDLAPAMQAKARSLWFAARDAGLIGSGSTADFQSSWDRLDFSSVPPPKPVLVIFSYFFASHALSVTSIRSLAEFIRRFAASRVDPLAILYMNSTQPIAGTKYEVFETVLGMDPDSTPPVRMSIEYLKKPGGLPAPEEFVQELFRLKGD